MRFAALLALGLLASTGLSAAGTLLSNTTPYSPGANVSNYLGGSSNVANSPNLLPSSLASRSFSPGLNLAGMNSRTMVKPRSLEHHWAVGIDSLPAVGIISPSSSLVAIPNALSVRWWATDRLGIDVLMSGNYSSIEAGKGELSPSVSSSPGNAFYAGGVGFRYNWSVLSHDLLSQLIVKASGAQSVQSISGSSGKANETVLATFVGGGFEAFIPGWDWLSVEGSAGITGFSQSLTPQSAVNGGSQTVSGAGLAGSGFSPINLAVHAYF